MNKKGVSVMIGYILLVSMAIIMGGVMYTWMKSYVPTQEIACPEGVSIIISDYSYDCAGKILNLTIKNNGRFDIAGYYIKGAYDVDSLAAEDLSKRLVSQTGFVEYSYTVVQGGGSQNQFSPGKTINNSFNLGNLGNFKKVEITPVRWQRDENEKLRFVGCGEKTSSVEILECN